jgi:hypothetical protein
VQSGATSNHESGPNASVQCQGPFERIAIDVAGRFPLRDQANRYLLITWDYFTKWLEAYTIPKEEDSTVAEALVTNFCSLEIPRELHSHHDHNFETCLMQEGFQPLRVNKMRTTPLYRKSDGMVERYIKTVEHL